MKKSRILICMLILLLTFTACDNNEENVSETTTTSQIVTTAEPTTVYIETTTAPETTETTILTTEITTQTTTPVTEASTTVSPSVTTTQRTTKVTTANESTTKAPATVSSNAKPTTTKATTTKPTTTKAPTTKPTEPSTKPTTTEPTTEPSTTQAKNYCTVRIECKTIYDNLNNFENNKKSFLTSSGVILDDVQVEISGTESAFEVLKKACSENVCTDNCKYCEQNGVLLEYTYTPAFNNYYIEGIHQIYEKDCGSQSGWMYSVNGTFPDVGSSSYTVSDEDVIVFAFTCNMGEDIGNSY